MSLEKFDKDPESQEGILSRPSEREIKQLIDNHLLIKELSRKKYDDYIAEMKKWAKGLKDEARADFFQHFTDEDFKIILERLGERLD
jgi:hypothetical protein